MDKFKNLVKSSQKVTSTKDLRYAINEPRNVVSINMRHLGLTYFEPLCGVVSKAQNLMELAITDSYTDGQDLNDLLRAVNDNRTIQKLNLDVKDNAYDEDCIDTIRELISRGILTSLEMPRGVKCNDMMILLRALKKSSCKLKVLSIKESVLDCESVESLAYLLESKKIKKHLYLDGCTGVRGSLLAENRRQLEACLYEYNEGKRIKVQSKLTIHWFSLAEQNQVSEISEFQLNFMRKIFQIPVMKMAINSIRQNFPGSSKQKTNERDMNSFHWSPQNAAQVPFDDESSGSSECHEMDTLAACGGGYDAEKKITNNSFMMPGTANFSNQNCFPQLYQNSAQDHIERPMLNMQQQQQGFQQTPTFQQNQPMQMEAQHQPTPWEYQPAPGALPQNFQAQPQWAAPGWSSHSNFMNPGLTQYHHYQHEQRQMPPSQQQFPGLSAQPGNYMHQGQHMNTWNVNIQAPNASSHPSTEAGSSRKKTQAYRKKYSSKRF